MASLPSSDSRDVRAIRSRNALRDALLRLLAARTFEQITINDICTEAGIHKSTFFRHHATKESLLEDIAADQIRDLNTLTMAVLSASDYRAAVHKLCSSVDEQRTLWSVLFNGGAGPAMRAEWVRHSLDVASSHPFVETWLPLQLGTIFAATLIAETVAWWVAQPPGEYSIDHVAEILLRVLKTAVMVPVQPVFGGPLAKPGPRMRASRPRP